MDWSGYAANCSMLFAEVSLLERPAAARAAGFEAIELWWPFASATPPTDELDALLSAIELAGRGVGGTILLEPVSGAPRYPLLTADDVMQVVWASGEDNIELLADLYHLSANGDDIGRVIARWVDPIGYVQIADFPGRHEPGTGEVDLAGHVRSLLAAGFDGWLALEYAPSGPTVDGLSWRSTDAGWPVIGTRKGE